MPHFPHWTWEKSGERKKTERERNREKGGTRDGTDFGGRKNMCCTVSSSSVTSWESFERKTATDVHTGARTVTENSKMYRNHVTKTGFKNFKRGNL